MSEFEKIKPTVDYQGYYYKISDMIKITILGLLSRQQTMKDIHGWAESRAVREMLREIFSIKKLPCYSQFTNIMGIIDSEELNKIFMEFFCKLVEIAGKTISFDGKTVRSTGKMGSFKSPLHIASAFVVENGITIGQLATDAKSNEIPAVQELIRLLNIEGATVVADALNCQKDTVKEILDAGADYVLSVKNNQKELFNDIKDMIDFKCTDKFEQIHSPVEKITKTEKNHGRIEKRTALVTQEVQWLQDRDEWLGVNTIGAIITQSQTRYYISSRVLSAEQLLTITRNEWGVESMHWQLDVIFDEDRTTLSEKNTQITLNILRKTVLNIVRTYRDRFEPKLNMVDILRKCSHDTDILIRVLAKFDYCV
jgi:predicted transposase YbfD/YdcC